MGTGTHSSIVTSWSMRWSGCSRRSQKGWNEMEIIWFGIGAFVGATVAALVMACCKAGGDGDR